MPTLLLPDSDIAAPISCILSDVDGVMTDGRIIYSDDGTETKQFHVRDGLAIKLWMKSGFQFGILTARTSPALERRASELGIEHVNQGCSDKLPAAREMMSHLGCSPEQVCYIGDDLPDIAVMHSVALAVAPEDASIDARHAANWILRSCGGQGALRELIERLLRGKHRWEEHVGH